MKDAKGHGSNNRGGKAKVATRPAGLRLVKTHTNGPHVAKVYHDREWGEYRVQFHRDGAYQTNADSHHYGDDLADANATAQHQLQRYADQDAAKALASGAKSAPVPTHDAMQYRGMPSEAAYDREMSSKFDRNK